jgi:aflatoxin B1 aldehyde reductase
LDLILSYPLARTIETELVPACRRYGLDLVVYNPLAGGLFSGKYSMNDLPGAGRFSIESTQQGTQYRARYFREEYFDALALIEPVAQAHSLTMIEIAIRWLIHHSSLDTAARTGGNDGILIGISSLSQLESNLKNAEKPPLPAEVMAVLDKAWKICKSDAPDYWQSLPLEYAYDTQKALFGR